MAPARSKKNKSALLKAALLRVASAAVMLVTAGGVLAAGPPSASALLASDAYQFVAKIQVGVPGAGAACTGALIAPRWVVTARACFGATVVDGAPAQPSTALIGWSDLSAAAGGHAVPIVRVVPHPDRDLVLARLAVAVPDVAPVAVATTAPADGDILTAAGFGRTAVDWVPDVPHLGTFTVGNASAAVVGLTGTAADQAGPCKGDAGGPGLRDAGGTLQLVAVTHSAVGQGGCLGADRAAAHGGTQTRVDDLGTWFAQYLPEKSVSTLMNDNSDLCLAITGGSTENAAQAIQWTCQGGTEQDWRLARRPSGAYEIRNDHSNLCLAIGGGSTETNVPVIQWPCGGDTHLEQSWELTADASGYSAIRNVNSKLCIAMGSATTTAGTSAIQWTCNGGREQAWKVTARTVGTRVVNQYSKLCLSNNGVETNAARMVQTTCTDANDAEWHLSARVGGYAQLVDDRSGQCLAIGGASTADNAAAIQWPCGDSTHGEQQWTVDDDATGATHLRNKATGKCLDIVDGSKTVGASLVQLPCVATDTGQAWLLTDN